MLRLVYANKDAADCPVLSEGILRPTQRPDAIDAFVSIVFSPKPARPFNDALSAAPCPVLLLYGRDDPWVVPLWGQRAMRVLEDGGKDAEYWEMTPAGHW